MEAFICRGEKTSLCLWSTRLFPHYSLRRPTETSIQSPRTRQSSLLDVASNLQAQLSKDVIVSQHSCLELQVGQKGVSPAEDEDWDVIKRGRIVNDVSVLDVNAKATRNRNDETKTSLTSVQSPAAYDEQIAAALLHVFFPRSNNHWLYDAVSAMPFSEPLTLSLRAFSLSRIGFAEKDQTLIAQSFATYVKALRSVRSCVSVPSATVDEGTATAVSVLSLFETFNQHESDTQGWNNHISGAVALFSRSVGVQSRLTRAIRKEVHRSAIIASLVSSEPVPAAPIDTFLDDDPSQPIWDLGAELSDINIRTRTGSDQNDALNLQKQSVLLGDILTLDEKFQQWEDLSHSSGTPYAVEELPSEAGSSPRLSYTFDSYSTGYTFNNYWGFRLLLAEIAVCLIDSMLDIPRSPAELARKEYPLAQHLSALRQHFATIRHNFAWHLVHGSQFALSPAAGLHGAHRISFAILLALYIFDLDNDAAGVQEAVAAIRRLTFEKGLGVASIAMKMMNLHHLIGTEAEKMPRVEAGA